MGNLCLYVLLYDYVFLLILISIISSINRVCLRHVWTPTPRVGARARNPPPRRNSPPSTAPLLSATLPLDGTDRFLVVQRNRPIVTARTSGRLDAFRVTTIRVRRDLPREFTPRITSRFYFAFRRAMQGGWYIGRFTRILRKTSKIVTLCNFSILIREKKKYTKEKGI